MYVKRTFFFSLESLFMEFLLLHTRSVRQVPPYSPYAPKGGGRSPSRCKSNTPEPENVRLLSRKKFRFKSPYSALFIFQ
jgi:hypothetical protein